MVITFKGSTLPRLQSVSLTWEWNLAIHNLPSRDKPYVENLGGAGASFEMEGIINETYSARYSTVDALRALTGSSGTIDFGFTGLNDYTGDINHFEYTPEFKDMPNVIRYRASFKEINNP